MSKTFRFLAAAFTAVSLLATSGAALAQPKDKTDKQEKQQGKGKAKERKNKSGKDLLGGKIKQNGRHKLEDNGKYSAQADVEGGKVKGVNVKHADKGDVPVTKYKSTKQVAARQSGNGIYLAQYGEVVATLWIGYAYIDDWGYEVIYWFPVDIVVDGAYGAVEYYDYYGY